MRSSAGKRERSRDSRDEYMGGGGDDGGDMVTVTVARRIYVGNLAYRTSWQVCRSTG